MSASFTDRKIYQLAQKVWPELDSLSTERQMVGVGDLLTSLYTLPFAIIGMIWLIRVTEISQIRSNYGLLLLHGGFILLFHRLNFFLIVELRENRYGSADGSLETVLLWSAVFLTGPIALWLLILIQSAEFLYNWPQAVSKGARWNRLRSYIQTLTSYSFTYLIGISTFRLLGGLIPITNLNTEIFLNGLVAIGIAFLVNLALWTGYIAYGTWTQIKLTNTTGVRPLLRFLILAIGLPVLAEPFGVITAGMYVEKGLSFFLILISGLFIVALLTRQLSWMAETSRQQSRILEKLEQLGRDIITAVPDSNSLPKILATYIPNMFPSGNIAIWTYPNTILFKNPATWDPPFDDITSVLLDLERPVGYLGAETLPWDPNRAFHNPIILTPIRDVTDGAPFGGIYIELRSLSQPWYQRNLKMLFPAFQTLSDQIASAVHQEEIYNQTLDYQRVSQELRFAGEIQASFMPFEIPRIPGWQLSVTLDPVGETSGDFFDIIPLGDNRLGIVIADVADKGIGPALYMALSRTLIRTYAIEFDAQPDIVFFAANERMLKDTEANLFVTVFYGILDLKTGRLTYANAGHNPPYLLRAQENGAPLPLRRTGIPIGIEEEITWSKETVTLESGDVLLLYTDGIPDAQNNTGHFFGEKTIVELGIENLGKSADEIQGAIIDAVYAFTGDAPQFDDITFIALIRD